MRRRCRVVFRDDGFSLLEALVIVAIIGVTALITIPNLSTMLTDYRLKVGTRQVMTAIQFARAKAVSENYNYTITMTSVPGADDTYQVGGGESDQGTDADGDGNNLDPWEDRNNNGQLDAVTYDAQRLPNGVDYVASVSVAPTGYPTTRSSSITFTPLGLPTFSGTNIIVYLENARNARSAVTVDNTGRVQMWLLRGSWQMQ